MPELDPATELDPQFSSEGATPTPWTKARELLEKAEVYWLSTVRPDGRPHVTPVVSIWLDGALFFCTGPSERKAKNLTQNVHCVITTGINTLSEGIDIVVEGDALRVRDEGKLQSVADKYASKYGPPFNFTVHDGDFFGEGGKALVFKVTPTTIFGFGKGESFSQTRWRFS
jgi:hypothetical protein